MTTELEEVKKSLTEKKIPVGSLTMLMTANGEQILGEVEGSDPRPGEVLVVKNPKRVIRLQQMTQSGVSISFLVGDLDLLSEGSIKVIAISVYRVMDQSDDSAERILSVYNDYLSRKVAIKAEEAGLVVPDSPIISPFKKR